MSDTFVCKFCGWTITQIYSGDIPHEETCVLCHWINDNKKLTPEEKEELRIRYARAIRGEKDELRNRDSEGTSQVRYELNSKSRHET